MYLKRGYGHLRALMLFFAHGARDIRGASRARAIAVITHLEDTGEHGRYEGRFWPVRVSVSNRRPAAWVDFETSQPLALGPEGFGEGVEKCVDLITSKAGWSRVGWVGGRGRVATQPLSALVFGLAMVGGER